MTTWLDKNNLHLYTELLHVERISLRLLAIMTQAELRDLGVASFGDRKRFLAAISKKREELYTEYIDLLVELDLNTPLLEGPGQGNRAAASQQASDVADKESGCLFEDSEAFTRAFETTESVIEFNKAFCMDCSLSRLRTQVLNCDQAKRAFRRQAATYHPDVVDRSHPNCGKVLKAWATAAMSEMAQQLNANCKNGRRKQKKTKTKKRHDEF